MIFPVPVETLRDWVAMDVATGSLTWRQRDIRHFADDRSCRSWNSKHAGKPAFDTANAQGYLYGRLLGVRIAAHRVVFAVAYGRWPEQSIDHINGNIRDNSPANLREVTHAENGRNCKRRSDNKSGMVGVFQSGNSFRAEICANGMRKHLGRFKTAEDALSARKSAEKELGFSENHGR